MTTFTDEDKELIKEIRERIGSLDVRDNIERRAYEIALASLEAEAVMFCISGQNVDSEEHVSTSKAVVDAWVEEWNQVDGSPGEPLYKTMPLYYHAALPAPAVPDGLVRAVRFYEQVKCENPPAETGAWKDAVDWVLKEACQAVNIGIKGE
ncbi:putative ycgB protein [Escherichia coli 99.0848]|nr:putative ycgB protein [Escherichia coli 99.0848]